MSEEREVLSPNGQKKSIRELMDTLSEDQLVSELAVILDRGHTNVRLLVDVPEDIHYEWVPNDPMEIYRKRSLGFEIDDKYAINSALHSDGTGKPIIGDVICMICPMKLKHAYDKLASKRYAEANGVRRKEKDTKEEKDFKKLSTSPGYVDPNSSKVDQSNLEVVDQAVINAAREANKKDREAAALSVNTTTEAS